MRKTPPFIKVTDNQDWNLKVWLEQRIHATFTIWHNEVNTELLETPVMRMKGKRYVLSEKALKELFGEEE